MKNKQLNVQKVERSVLATFKEEIPSIYFSDKSEKEFLNWNENALYLYRDLLKFPPPMFKDRTLLDCGAGTGENTVYLANWGARCVLVDMNDKALEIAKDVFKKHAPNPKRHRFICSSLFDFRSNEKFDIVHCRGVLSHTADNEGLFTKISSFLKPGGYLIFGDPNKAGGFQNMLQSYIIYKFAKSWDEMVEVAEKIFKEDIDRSQRFIPRTRRAIIFDRWVVQQQNDPSVKEVLRWFDKNELVLYSSYPPILFPALSDSAHNKPKFLPQSFKNLGVLTEALWLMHQYDDDTEFPKVLQPLSNISEKWSDLITYVSNCNADSRIEGKLIKPKIDAYLDELKKLNLTSYINKRMKELMEEVKKLFEITENEHIMQVKKYIKETKHLFRGANGVRHVDYIAYKK